MAAASASLLAAPVLAAAVHEGNLTGFVDDSTAPTLLGEDVRQVTGTGESQAFDFFTFTLPAGAEALSFDFWAPRGIGYSYPGGSTSRTGSGVSTNQVEPPGGAIRTSAGPIRTSPNGQNPGTAPLDRRLPTGRAAPVRSPVFAGPRSAGIASPTGSGSTGPQDMGFLFPDGQYIAEPVGGDGEAPPSVVPLPGAGGMLLSVIGIAGLIALGHSRRACHPERT